MSKIKGRQKEEFKKNLFMIRPAVGEDSKIIE